jgi:hypothetical protein
VSVPTPAARASRRASARRRLAALIARATCIVLPSTGIAADAPPSKPDAAYQRLGFFEGTWTTAGADPAREFREHCAWLEGMRRHMVCRSRWRDADGEWREGLSLFSFRAADGKYLYYGLRSSGNVEAMSGEPTADGWVFERTDTAAPDAERVRVTIRRSADGFDLHLEGARGEAPLRPLGTTRYLRISP